MFLNYRSYERAKNVKLMCMLLFQVNQLLLFGLVCGDPVSPANLMIVSYNMDIIICAYTYLSLSIIDVSDPLSLVEA